MNTQRQVAGQRPRCSCPGNECYIWIFFQWEVHNDYKSTKTDLSWKNRRYLCSDYAINWGNYTHSWAKCFLSNLRTGPNKRIAVTHLMHFRKNFCSHFVHWLSGPQMVVLKMPRTTDTNGARHYIFGYEREMAVQKCDLKKRDSIAAYFLHPFTCRIVDVLVVLTGFKVG